jgi:hypothetical protein
VLLGAFIGVAARNAAGQDRVVDLPPLTVAEPVNGPPWRYIEVPGYEVLSRCNDATAVYLLREMTRLQRWLGVMLPDELLAKRAVPTAVVLYSEENKPVVSQEVVAALMQEKNGPEDSGRRSGRGEVRYNSLPSMRLADKDAVDFFFILNDKEFSRSESDFPPDATRSRGRFPAFGRESGRATLGLTADAVRYMVRNRIPAPPAWFVDGIADLYDTANFDSNPVVFSPLVWISPVETAKIRQDPDYPRELLPLADLFTLRTAPGQDATLWRSESMLFIRWALDGKEHPRRDALWKFVERASTGPVTEDIFQQCFGLGYVDAQERISDYLSNAVNGVLKLSPEGSGAPLKPEPRVATELEIARIKGDWERLEIGYIKSRYPELAEKYVEQARRTLMRAYSQGERDPRLLAVMGLCECDAGNDAGARPYLEEAAKAGVVRPRVYYELARLRYAEARTKPALPDGHLSAAQATEVLKPLGAAYQQMPPLLEIYALTAEVWSRSDVALGRRNLDMLGQGVGFFPWNAPFIYQTAWLNLRSGFKDEAGALIARGLRTGPDATYAARFEQLRATLAATPNPAGPP